MMRIRRLELLRYGKFTDKVIELPRATHDFHLIVGPNEAGKSTFRTAVTELLYGMPRSSPLGFVHAQSELRLGALLETAEGELAFHRSKATKAPLRDPATDTPLADDLLAACLGSSDRAFFEQMFGLDHARLVQGAQTILDASRDVGQVLFQSAAGIASLGPVSERLSQEAARLWAPRRASDRAWYQALDRLAEANDELKGSLVRTKAWSEAQAALDEVLDRIAREGERHAQLEAQRTGLERVRRLAPQLSQLQALEDELAQLGEVIELPADAAGLLARGQEELAAAEAELQVREQDWQQRRLEREQIRPDAAVLALQPEIAALQELRVRCRDHEREIGLQQAEAHRLWQEIATLALQVGWQAEEEAIRAQLPSELALRTVTRLLQERGALQAATRQAAEALARMQQEVDEARRELASQGLREVPPALREAIAQARGLRSSQAGQARKAQALQDARRALEQALQALGRWQQDLVALRALFAPSTERMARLRAERQSLSAQVAQAGERLRDAQGRIAATQLKLQQVVAGHRLVSEQDVREARAGRDAIWLDVKTGARALLDGAPALDEAIARADEQVDARLASASRAAQWEALQQQQQQETLLAAQVAEQAARAREALQAFDQAWDDEAGRLGLAGMQLDDLPGWLLRRDAALMAADAVEAAERELRADEAAWQAGRETLAAALQSVGVQPEAEDLPALVNTAEAWQQSADAGQARRSELERRVAAGERDLRALQQAQAAAGEDWREWTLRWDEALQVTRLQGVPEASLATAVELVADIAGRLRALDRVRREGVEARRTELEALARDARRIASTVAPDLLALDNGPEIARRLGLQLQAEVEAAQAARRAEAGLEQARQALEAVRLKVSQSRARIQPLLDQVGASTVAEALPQVQRSDRRRELVSRTDGARRALLEQGDGLSLAQIRQEVQACDVAALPAQLETVEAGLADCGTELQRQAARKVEAEQVLAGMAGQPRAAVAEAKRQEALASMADVSERYLQLATASRLLKWAVDRYRDRHQGPMLTRASALFAQLTLGGFQKLLVDYDENPPQLSALRAGGQVVPVAGLSEGTRDQLYLALRLAALELHLEQSRALPFVADDLFINFDDGRTRAGLEALKGLSQRTQVLFLTHHQHLEPIVQQVFEGGAQVVRL